MKSLPRIGITLGDVNGIGPEVALKAATQLQAEHPTAQIVLIGDNDPVKRLAKQLRLPVPPAVHQLDEIGSRDHAGLFHWNPTPHASVALTPGRIVPEASIAAAAWIEAAVTECLKRELDAVVTAPICKEGFAEAGIPFPGHTEYLARLTQAKRFAMMLFGGSLRVVLATRHDPLAMVPSLLTQPLILDHLRLTAQALPWLGAPQQPIAVCGLNPHAGEGGTIGREEIDVILPAIKAAQREGLDVEGPFPADTIFHRAATGEFSAVLAMYHDQGLGPLKLIAFDTGVNVTLGLPIVRTSPDHGTAFSIAGKNQANPSSMTEAVRHAIAIATRQNPWA